MTKQATDATAEQTQDFQRALRALQGGIKYLIDEEVTGPMKHADGVSDLKWLLGKLMTGEWALNMDPQRKKGPSTEPIVPQVPQGAEPLEEPKAAEVVGGNGSK